MSLPLRPTTSRATHRPLVCLALTCVTLLWAGSVSAQVLAPQVGRQFGTVGLSMEPGVIHDPRGAERHGLDSSSALTGAGMLSLGLHHILSANFSMAGEIALGTQWVSQHTATSQGVADSQSAFAFQLSLLGRWFPIAHKTGFTAAVGTNYYRASLQDAPLNVAAAEVRLGRFMWTSDDNFLIVELGYLFPLIQGLSLDNDFTEDGELAVVERTWSFHRFTLGFQVAW